MSVYPSPRPLVTPPVGAVSITVIAFNPARTGLLIYNTSDTLTLWVSPLEIQATVRGAGCIGIEPQQSRNFGPPDGPTWTNGMNAIASGAGPTNITALEYYGGQ